jgi:hypothetical protein
MGSAMKPCSEFHELLTVTMPESHAKNVFAAHYKRRASLNLSIDKQIEKIALYL